MNYTTYTLEDYLANESFINYCFRTNQNDVAYWEEVLIQQPDLSEDIRQAKKICLLLGVRVDDIEKNEAFVELQKAIDTEEQKYILPREKTHRLFGQNKWWISIAASILIITGAYLLLRPKTFVEEAITYALQQEAPPTVATTAIDQRKKITLPDGTHVLLNGTSQLSIASDFNQKHRIVWLVGEGYFEVAKDKTKPFIVRTASTVTTALGTAFKVKNYPNQDVSYVMLTSGSVQIDHIDAQQHKLATTILQPGQRAMLNKGEQLRVSSFDAQEINEWLTRKLTFQASGFDEIQTKLCDIYGVSLVADQNIASSLAFTGHFVDRELTEVLDAISFSNRMKFVIEGNKIIMQKSD